MIYPYRCQDCGIRFDRVFSMSTYPAEVECKCGGVGHRVIATGIQFGVEYVERVNGDGFNRGAGRAFSNRREMNEWMKANEMRLMGPEEVAVERQYLSDLKQAKADLGDAFTGDLPRPAPKALGIPEETLVEAARYAEQASDERIAEDLAIAKAQVDAHNDIVENTSLVMDDVRAVA